MEPETDATIARPPRLARWRSLFATVARTAVDVVLPPQCLSCRAATAGEGSLCARCWSRMRLIERPYCARLGIPFAYDLGEGALSAEAIADPPPFDRCRAVATFDEVARALVHGLKYRDRPELARAMGDWMVRAGGEIVATADVIVPVPLHRRRLWSRRFNQSAMLAQAIARRSGRRFAPEALARIRPTVQQVGLSQAARDDNVRGVFRVLPPQKMAVAGRRVLLVDDVYTTGATAKAATRALLRGGATAVDVLVFARVVRGEG
jgi:ComF family protein